MRRTKQACVISLLLGLQIQHSHAAPVIQVENDQTYAAPCEDVRPESDLLNNFLKNFNQTSKPQQGKVIEQFWQTVTKATTPIVEPIDEHTSRMVYLWRGAKQNVRLVGGPSNDHEWLTRLKNTDIWFKEAIVKNDFIGSYSFAVDIKNIDGYLSHYCPHLNPNLRESRAQRVALRESFQLDPFNPRRFLSHEISRLRNENIVQLAQAPNFINPQQYQDRALRIKRLTLKSATLQNEREIKIYQSAKQHAKQPYITVIFFDGHEYASLLNVPKVLDILVEKGKLPAIQAIFIDQIDAETRPKELTPNDEFSRFFKDEFLPWLDQQIDRDPKKTVLLGSSLGGLSSAYLALENPNDISHVVPMSGSFWWQKNTNDLPNGMSRIIRQREQHVPQQWFISANSYEDSRVHNQLSILNTSPVVAADLKQKGHHVIYKNYTGGHSYALWQVVLQDALQYFFTEPKTLSNTSQTSAIKINM